MGKLSKVELRVERRLEEIKQQEEALKKQWEHLQTVKTELMIILNKDDDEIVQATDGTQEGTGD